MGGGGHSLLHDVEQNAKKKALNLGIVRIYQLDCVLLDSDRVRCCVIRPMLTPLVASAVWGVSTCNTKRVAEQATIAGAPWM
jgi:hypothetical protein